MKVKVWVALLAVYIVWGSTYLSIRFAVESIPPFLMAGIRFLVAGLILYVWRRLAGDPSPTPRQWRSAVIVGLLLLLGGNGLVSLAEQHVASGIAALMIASVPLWMALIDSIRPKGITPDWKIILGLMVGFGGLALLVTSSNSVSASEGMNPLGIGALLLASLLWSIGSVYSQGADMPESSLLGSGMEMLGGAAGLFLMGTFTGEWTQLHIASITIRSLLGLSYLITFGSLVGFVSYAWLLRNAPLSLVSTYAYVNPVVAIFVGAWLGNELINSRIILAALIIIGSVVVINQSKQTKVIQEKKTAAPVAEKREELMDDY
jgi:drug/metabolite transporter (DMT)-like permease